MALTGIQMLDRLKDRTFQNDQTKLIGELNSAKDWAFTRLYNSENGPDQIITFHEELTMSARTREYDLGANVTGGTIYGIKTLWLKLASDINFTPMLPADAGDRRFLDEDEYPSSDTTTVATGHPVLYDVINFAKIRFAPPLPSGAIVRVDFWRKPPDIDPAVNNTLVYADDIPEPLHEAILDKATAQLFTGLDDDREMTWEARAERKLNDALFLVNRRAQGPTRTKPFRRYARRPI